MQTIYIIELIEIDAKRLNVKWRLVVKHEVQMSLFLSPFETSLE